MEYNWLWCDWFLTIQNTVFSDSDNSRLTISEYKTLLFSLPLHKHPNTLLYMNNILCLCNQNPFSLFLKEKTIVQCC